jgi:site-specific DNA-methyltransferase (adenine-specific)
MIETGKILQGDCIEVMKTLPLDSVDLVVTSPPYNVGIDYDSYDDKMSMEDYWNFTRQWLTEAYKTLKDDGLEKYKILDEEFKNYRNLTEIELKLNEKIA